MKAGWGEKTLGELCHIARGGSPRPIQTYLTDDPTGVNWIKISDATASGKYIFQTEQKIRKEGVSRSRMVKEGDFLLSNSMSFGRPYVMKTTGCIHDGWLVLSDKSGLFDQDFLYHFLGSQAAFNQFDLLAAGSTVRNLNIDLAKKVRVPVPPLPEQRRIVSILDETFAGLKAMRANAEKNLQNARELFESYLNAVFSNDVGWTEKSFDEICVIESKLVDPREPSYMDLPHLGAGNMVSRTGALTDIKTAREEGLISGKFFFDRRMVLYSKIRPYLMKACRPEFEGLCSADVYPLLPKEGIANRDFLFHLLMTPRFTDYAIHGSARAGMPKVNREHLFAYRCKMPDVKTQEALAERLDSAQADCSQLEAIYEKKFAVIDELKQSILQKAFAGELTSTEAVAA